MPRLMAAPPPRALPASKIEKAPFWWFKWIPSALFASAVLYLIYIVGREAIIPVLASFALAYVMNPIVEAIERRGFSRTVSATLGLTAVTLATAAFLWFVIPDLWEQSVKAGDAILKNFTPENARLAREKLREISPILDRIAGLRIYQFLRSQDSLMQASQSWVAGGLTDFLATASGALDLLIIPFFVFYILVDFSNWRTAGEDLIPPRFRDPFSRLFDEVGRILQAYVLGQLLIALAMAILYAVGFAFLRVPAWAGLAALSGFLNVIPYVGTGLGIVLATGFTFASGAELWRVLGVLGVFFIVQMIEGYYLTPRVLGERLSLHPMAVFLGLLVGGRMFGFLGILLAVPVLAIAQVFIKFIREIYKSSEYYWAGQIGPDPPPIETVDVLSKAADKVLNEQVDSQSGEELLSPETRDDDRVARDQPA